MRNSTLAKLFYTLLLLVVAAPVVRAAATQPYVNRYSDPSFGRNIHLQGTPHEAYRLADWLDQIAAVPKGRETMRAIQDSGHELVIQHAAHAVISAGRTRAPMSQNLTNGEGESVQILFNAHIPDRGSHMVYNGRRDLIEYTAVQNLYHELAHAMHMMNGTWRYFASEKQAIEEENIFRRDLAEIQGRPATMRFRKSGIMISEIEAAQNRKASHPPAASSSLDWVGATGVSRAIRVKE
jgi:hypothetical protein